MQEIPQTQVLNENINPQTYKEKNKWLLIGGIIALIFILLSGVIFGYQYYQTLNIRNAAKFKTEKPSGLANETDKSVQWIHFADFQTRSTDLDLLLSPSLLDILSNEKTIGYSCIDLVDSIKSIEELSANLKNNQLISGLQEIANHIFTTPLLNEKGNSLTSIQSKYEIQLNDVCRISNNKFVVLFLTTQQINKKLSLISKAQAGGGWLGDSHVAIIDDGNTKIYERFPFDAKLIKLPKEKNQNVILRFGAYYNCKNLIFSTNNHLIINCNNNMFSFDIQNELFKEIAICGNHIKNGSYMTSRHTCFDTTGKSYLNTE